MNEKTTKPASTEDRATSRYFEGVGRRKTAVARVRIKKGPTQITVNAKPFAEFFQM